ncbi:MAG: alpha/beta fold hydrolase [Acetobacteraceae bacterium]|nr:alpha/beta fold hydrolase [Acetobacteraceae bacterium]
MDIQAAPTAGGVFVDGNRIAHAPYVSEPVPELAESATILRTPCGDGSMVWRRWGRGSPLVLLHGGTGSWRHWAGNIAELSRHYQVFAADAPGLGDSDMMHETPDITPESVSAIVADGLSRVLPEGARFDIIGFSFGAMVATHVAAMHGPRARSLTIVGPAALGFSRPAVPLEKVRNKQGAARYEANRKNLGMFMYADPGRITEQAVAIQDWNTVHARFKSKGFAGSTSLRDAAGRATARLTAVWGDGDVTAFPSIGARMESLRTTRPDAELRVIEGAGHWVAYEAAEAFTALALEILGDAEGT